MASCKYKEWLDKDKLILLRGWARNGLTDEQISHNMGIAKSTYYDWKKKNVEISNALKKGKEVVDLEVENSLYKKAMGYRYKEITKENVLNPLTQEYELVVTKEVEKEMPPDTTAQIYWLKNRKPRYWRDRVDFETNKEQLTKVEELLSKIKDEANDNK